jgi:hypothetical protein
MIGLSWGSWAVRVYAAQAWLELAPRFAMQEPHIADMLERMAADPAPQVRVQVASHLQLLSKADPERTWRIAEALASAEPHGGVLAALLARSVRQMPRADFARGERLIETVRARAPIANKDAHRSRDDIQWAIGSLAAQLYVGDGRPLAREWIGEWAKDLAAFGDSLDSVVSSLNGCLFERYGAAAEEEDRLLNDRAQECLTFIVRQSLEAARTARAILASTDATEEEKAPAAELYKAAEGLIHHACNLLYFGSGAHANKDRAPGLLTDEARRGFLDGYAELLDLLARSHEPRTHHHLLELYEYLVPANPALVLGAMHALLTGRAAEEGYQYESLGLTVVVRIVRRFLADHRSLFDEPEQRQRLSDMLTLFSDEGWPEALQLLYDLPDLLR